MEGQFGPAVMESHIKYSLIVGGAAGAALSTWSLVTMLLPVSYLTWNVGRSILFVAFMVALTLLGASRARSSAVATFGAVAVACLAAAGVTLASYALSTGYFAQRIVQLPEYLRDYTYHGYTSPALYLSTNYTDLLGLQIFSWAITVSGLLVITGTAGLWLGRCRSRTQAARHRGRVARTGWRAATALSPFHNGLLGRCPPRVEWIEMVDGPGRELPDDDDVIIWHLEERDGLDVYRVTKGETILGEFTGRSIGATVFQKAVEHADPGRAVWLKDERRFRRLNPLGCSIEPGSGLQRERAP